MDWSSCSGPLGIAGAATFNCIPLLIRVLLLWAIIFAGVTSLFLIIYSGIKFMLSGGDAKRVESAKKTLTFAVAGLLIILLSFFIINTIAYVTNVRCIKFIGFDNCV